MSAHHAAIRLLAEFKKNPRDPRAALITGAALPVDLQTFAPLAGGPLFDEAEALPSDIPASLHPTHQVSLVPGSPGQLNIEARTSLTTLGAIE